jgi:predicted Rossmann-fold nucleotide-binding protein
MKLEGMLFVGGDRQGEVKSAIGSCHYLVSLFSWLDGSTTKHIVVSLEDMESWSFYDDDEQFQDKAQEYLTEKYAKDSSKYTI